MGVGVSTLTLVRLTPPLGYGYVHASPYDTRACLQQIKRLKPCCLWLSNLLP